MNHILYSHIIVVRLIMKVRKIFTCASMRILAFELYKGRCSFICFLWIIFEFILFYFAYIF